MALTKGDIIGGGTLSPLTGAPLAAIGLSGSNPFGGHTNKGSYQGINFGSSTDSRIQDYINQVVGKINAASGAGTYGEGRFTEGIKALTDLQTQLSSGKLSQSDYVKVADQVLPQLYQGVIATGGSGSAAASAVKPFSDQILNLYNNYQVLKTGQQMLGRDLTPQEIAQATPAFGGPNGQQNGAAFLANLSQQYKANPSLDPGNQIKSGDATSQVAQQFKSILGRDPTQDELSHFSQAIQSGQTDAYGVGAYLKQQPEYTNAQDAQFRSGLNTELQNYDVQEFNREKGDVASSYANRGMSVSPSLDYALTDMMGKIASNRSAYLANLSASQYGGNKDLAVGNYQNTLNQMYSNNQATRQNQNNYSNYLIQRGNQGTDYTTQMNDYMNYLNNQPKPKTSPFDYLNAGLNVVNTGANLARSFGGGY